MDTFAGGHARVALVLQSPAACDTEDLVVGELGVPVRGLQIMPASVGDGIVNASGSGPKAGRHMLAILRDHDDLHASLSEVEFRRLLILVAQNEERVSNRSCPTHPLSEGMGHGLIIGLRPTPSERNLTGAQVQQDGLATSMDEVFLNHSLDSVSDGHEARQLGMAPLGWICVAAPQRTRTCSPSAEAFVPRWLCRQPKAWFHPARRYGATDP